MKFTKEEQHQTHLFAAGFPHAVATEIHTHPSGVIARIMVEAQGAPARFFAGVGELRDIPVSIAVLAEDYKQNHLASTAEQRDARELAAAFEAEWHIETAKRNSERVTHDAEREDQRERRTEHRPPEKMSAEEWRNLTAEQRTERIEAATQANIDAQADANRDLRGIQEAYLRELGRAVRLQNGLQLQRDGRPIWCDNKLLIFILKSASKCSILTSMRETLQTRLSKRIDRKRGDVFVRSDFNDLGGYIQVGRALRRLVDEGKLVKVGFGLYARAVKSPFSNATLPANGLETLKEALQRVGIETVPSRSELDYNAGRTTQVPSGRRVAVTKRVRRKVGYNGISLSFERARLAPR